jgi:hypothetical protein
MIIEDIVRRELFMGKIDVTRSGAVMGKGLQQQNESTMKGNQHRQNEKILFDDRKKGIDRAILQIR